MPNPVLVFFLLTCWTPLLEYAWFQWQTNQTSTMCLLYSSLSCLKVLTFFPGSPAFTWLVSGATESPLERPFLGPPVVSFYPFFGEGSPTKTDYRHKGSLSLTSLLEDLARFNLDNSSLYHSPFSIFGFETKWKGETNLVSQRGLEQPLKQF